MSLFPGFTPFRMTQNNDEQSWCYSRFDLFVFFIEFPFIFMLNCGCLFNSVVHIKFIPINHTIILEYQHNFTFFSENVQHLHISYFHMHPSHAGVGLP